MEDSELKFGVLKDPVGVFSQMLWYIVVLSVGAIYIVQAPKHPGVLIIVSLFGGLNYPISAIFGLSMSGEDPYSLAWIAKGSFVPSCCYFLVD